MKTLRHTVPLLFVLLVAAVPSTAEETAAEPSLEVLYRTAAEALAGAEQDPLIMPDEEMAADRARLAAVIRSGERWAGLSAGERAGILVALADRTALDGDRAGARTLYGILTGCGSAPLEDWSTYMLAGLDFADGAYAEAAAGYDRVCDLDEPGPWREHACAMAGLARRLDEIQPSGGEHGGPVNSTP